MTRAAALLGCSITLLLALTSAASADGIVKAGAAKVDGTYHVGSSAGQYASTRDGGYGDYDPNFQSVKNKASYGVQSRESARAVVIKGADGKYAAIVSDDHYIPQDALWRRTAQLASASTGGALNESNITMAITHNHSSPSYSSLNWGVWTFQDVFDFRFYDYYAKQNAAALTEAFNHLHNVRVSATAGYFDKTQRNPLGAGTDDDGAPAQFTDSFADHDLSVIRFENIDNPAKPKPLSTLVNLGQHPEFLEGYDLITSEFPGFVERFVDRTVGGITLFTQNATGNTEIEQETYHSIHEREAFDHTQYAQDEWAGKQIGAAVIDEVRTQIDPQVPNPDTTRHFGMASYNERFVPWMSSFPVGVEDRWFPGPVSHPYPGVNNCRMDPALAGNPVVGSAASCDSVPAGESAQPLTDQIPGGAPSITSDDFEALGIPFPENFSTPAVTGLEDTIGVHMQAIRLGDILITVCSCEQWTDQAYDIKTRTDKIPGNQWLGYDSTNPPVDDKEHADNACTQSDAADKHWVCHSNRYAGGTYNVDDHLIQRYRSRTYNDAAGWDDPTCQELGCGAQAESESTDLTKIFGNYTHDDTSVRSTGPNPVQTQAYADQYGYKMVVTMSMANDYNGYIATYRDYMGHDHYRKTLTGWGPHSSDFYATRLTRMGHTLKGDAASKKLIDIETDPQVAASNAPAYAHAAAREIADQKAEEAKITAVGEASSAAAAAYDKTIPDDGFGAPGDFKQPKSIERFDATTFTWVGGNNYDDDPNVVVQRKVDGDWETFADQTGEVPVSLAYPGSDPSALVADRTPGQVWKWTATFEAFVSRFGLVDPQGRTYQATPAGTYRFVVDGVRRSGGRLAPYQVVSDEFDVKPWDGITVLDPSTDDSRHVTFGVGPTHTAKELRNRGTSTPVIGGYDASNNELPFTFTIGPVDYPDTAANQTATGFRFLDKARSYSVDSKAQAADGEHYCLDCRFRDWLDVAGELTATVTFHTNGGTDHVEKVTSSDGTFRTDRALGNGQTADIVVEDAWGNSSGAPVAVD